MKHKTYNKQHIHTCKICRAIAYMKIEEGKFKEIEVLRVQE